MSSDMARRLHHQFHTADRARTRVQGKEAEEAEKKRTEFPQFNISSGRIRFEENNDRSGEFALIINPSLAPNAEDAVCIWAQQIGGLAVTGSNVGQALTVSGGVQGLKALIARIKENGSLKSAAAEVVNGNLHRLAGTDGTGTHVERLEISNGVHEQRDLEAVKTEPELETVKSEFPLFDIISHHVELDYDRQKPGEFLLAIDPSLAPAEESAVCKWAGRIGGLTVTPSGSGKFLTISGNVEGLKSLVGRIKENGSFKDDVAEEVCGRLDRLARANRNGSSYVECLENSNGAHAQGNESKQIRLR